MNEGGTESIDTPTKGAASSGDAFVGKDGSSASTVI
jgi:hypothetical protein